MISERIKVTTITMTITTSGSETTTKMLIVLEYSAYLKYLKSTTPCALWLPAMLQIILLCEIILIHTRCTFNPLLPLS